MNTITYTYRGSVERGNGKPGYDWHAGYSETSPEGAVLYPWMTHAECQADAKARHCQARFDHRHRQPAPLPGRDVPPSSHWCNRPASDVPE